MGEIATFNNFLRTNLISQRLLPPKLNFLPRSRLNRETTPEATIEQVSDLILREAYIYMGRGEEDEEDKGRNYLSAEITARSMRSRANEALMADAAGSRRRANERSNHRYCARTMNINQLTYEERGN